MINRTTTKVDGTPPIDTRKSGGLSTALTLTGTTPLLTISLIVILSTMIHATGKEPGAKIEASQPTTFVPGEQNIPIYQGTNGTDVVEKPKGLPEVYRTVVYTTTAPLEAVKSFYLTIMPNYGWTLDTSGTDRQVSELMKFQQDAKDGVPYSTKLTVIITQFSNNKPSRVTIDITRIPQANQPPVYPNAREISTADKGREIDGMVYHVWTYETEASSGDVYAYYKNLLPRQGWRLYADGEYEGVAAMFAKRSISARIQIVATRLEDKRTQIEVSVGSY